MNINQLIAVQVEDKIITCGIHRIQKCIDQLTEQQLQYRPNDNCNSINNLILHLDGNVRQWLIATMSSADDQRNRNEEFDSSNQLAKHDLKEVLSVLEYDIRSILNDIEKIDLLASQDVQCYREPNLGILVHVIEHFSYHVGQITYITKMLLDIDTGYYAGQDLTKVN